MGLEETMVWLRLQERRKEMEAIARERALSQHMTARPRARRSGLRRAVGLTIVRIGDWLAAEDADRTTSTAS